MSETIARRLLIVDDEAEIRSTLEQYFQQVGYRVETAPDVAAALTKLTQGFDVVLSDIKMPGASGIDFLAQARRLNSKVGIFLITGYPTLETIIDAKQHGAVAYFRKPLKLVEVDSRLRTFLGEDARSLVDGRVLVLGQELLERLRARLVRVQAIGCEAEETAFLQMVAEQRPKAVLADAAQPGTPNLLRAYQQLGRDANCFILVSGEEALDATNEMLFAHPGVSCVAMDAPQEILERSIKEAVEERERRKLDEQSRVEELTNKCMFAKAYRNGYYCLKQGNCALELSKGGWIAIEGKEYQKCPKRPLVVESLPRTGFTAWNGDVAAARSPEIRKQLLTLIRERKREIVIDCQALRQVHFNLLEILSDAAEEMVKLDPSGILHLINLSAGPLEEFRKAGVPKNVRCSGLRMVDERSTFEQWGTRFD